jgi:peptide/nickel transport system substrate-binding protein
MLTGGERMLRTRVFSYGSFLVIQFLVAIILLPTSLAQEWGFREKPRGTIKVVDFFEPFVSVMRNYAEGLLTTDKDNNLIPCLAEDFRWVNDRTIEFKLRQGVTFHNGEKFNASALRVNWEAYKDLKTPRVLSVSMLPDETILKVIDDYTVRFTLPEPDALAFVKFRWFFQAAPAFLANHEVPEKNWLYLPEAGPWGTGPFKFVEGKLGFGKRTERFVLEAYEGYWDRRYPKVQKVIFDNSLIGNRSEAVRLCCDEEGKVDIVSFVRPLDTLRVAESRFAQVMKSRDDTALACFFNERKEDSKWRDVRLRKAINYAINRRELWEYVARGNAFNLGGYIPPGAFGHDPNLVLYTYDTDKAKALLKEAGYPEGFEMEVITYEAWKLEAQIIAKMLERIGLRVTVNVYPRPQYLKKTYIPLLDKPPEQQDWDIGFFNWQDYYGHIAAIFLSLGFLEESHYRWMEYDPIYEAMWKDMTITIEPQMHEEKVRNLGKYLYERAHLLFIYSPMLLYATNKEVNFVPQKFGYLRLKETSVTENHWSVRSKGN